MARSVQADWGQVRTLCQGAQVRTELQATLLHMHRCSANPESGGSGVEDAGDELEVRVTT